MSVRHILYSIIATAIMIAVLVSWFRTQDQTAVQAELKVLVRQYDDAVYIEGDYEAGKNAANKILGLASKSKNSNAVQVRGLMRLVYLEIRFGKWGNKWGNDIKTCQALVSREPTIDRAEFLLYLGSIRGKWQGKFDEGLKQIQEALWIANRIKDDRTLALAYARLSELHNLLNQSSLVAENAYRGVVVAKSYGQKSVVLNALRNLIIQLKFVNNLPEAAKFAKQLLELKPNAEYALFVLHLANESDQFEEYVDNRIREVEKFKEDGGSLTNLSSARFGKLLNRSAVGYLRRNEFAKCRELAELAVPYLKAAGDNTSLNTCMRMLTLAKLEQADDVAKVNKIAAAFGEYDHFPANALAAMYAKVGALQKSLHWKERVVERVEKRQRSDIGFLSQSAELYWESELKLRKKIASSDEVVAKSTRRVWVLSTALVLGLTICGLLGSFYFLLRRKSNSLEETVKSRTMSLSKAMQDANAADRAKSDFLAQINHEIRNPLTAILGYCELLSSGSSTQRSSEFVAGIESSSQHLRELVDKILEVAKIESNGLETESVTFSLEQIVGDINGIMAEQATQKGLELNCGIYGNQKLSIISDETKIRQIALNLVNNAIKFTEKGTVNVSFELKQQDDFNNGQFVIVVNDSGIGIPEKEKGTIFDRFSKASNGEVQDGSGLGLFIVRQLAKCLDGEITLNSELGVGTRVVVSIPVEVSNGLAPDSQVKNGEGQTELQISLSKSVQRVLVVDDQEMIRTTLQMQLNATGLECETTDELGRTIEVVENWRPNLVLLDLRMPKHSGFEVLEKIRQSNNSSIPVYAITGDATDLVKQKCLSAGFDGFITKPFKMSTILEVVHSTSERIPIGCVSQS